MCAERGNKRIHDCSCRRSEVGADWPWRSRNISNSLRGVCRIERVGQQHGVITPSAKLDSLPMQSVHGRLYIVKHAWDCCIFD